MPFFFNKIFNFIHYAIVIFLISFNFSFEHNICFKYFPIYFVCMDKLMNIKYSLNFIYKNIEDGSSYDLPIQII